LLNRESGTETEKPKVEARMIWPRGYGSGNKNYRYDFDQLAQDVARLRRCSNKHLMQCSDEQIAITYVDYVTALQEAADLIETNELSTKPWATEMIREYKDPVHKFPLSSTILDKALAERAKLVQCTDETTVGQIEANLKRVTIEKRHNTGDFDHYKHRSLNAPDVAQ